MSFKQIRVAGSVARMIGSSLSDNPYYRSENLPADTAAGYRAWQIKAEVWESGWHAQDEVLSSSPHLVPV